MCFHSSKDNNNRTKRGTRGGRGSLDLDFTCNMGRRRAKEAILEGSVVWERSDVYEEVIGGSGGVLGRVVHGDEQEEEERSKGQKKSRRRRNIV